MTFPVLRFQPCPHCCDSPECQISSDPLIGTPKVWNLESGTWYPGAQFLQLQGDGEAGLIHRPTAIVEPAYVLSVNWQIFAAGQVLDMSVAVDPVTLEGLTVRFAPGHNNTGWVGLYDYDGTELHVYTLTYLNFQDVTAGGVFTVCIEPVMGQYYVTATSYLYALGSFPERLTFPAYTRGEHWGKTVSIGTPLNSIVNLYNATLYETANEEKGCPTCTLLGCHHCNNGITSKCLKLTFEGVVPNPNGPASCDCYNREYVLSWYGCGLAGCTLPFHTYAPIVDPLFIGFICEGPGSCGDQWFSIDQPEPDGNTFLTVSFEGIRFRKATSLSEPDCRHLDETLPVDPDTLAPPGLTGCDFSNATVRVQSVETGCPGCGEDGDDDTYSPICVETCGCGKVSLEIAVDLDGVVMDGIDRTGTYIVPMWNTWACFEFATVNSAHPFDGMAIHFFVHKPPVGSAYATLRVYNEFTGVSDAIDVTLPLDCHGGDTFAFSLGGGTALVTPL